MAFLEYVAFFLGGRKDALFLAVSLLFLFFQKNTLILHVRVSAYCWNVTDIL